MSDPEPVLLDGSDPAADRRRLMMIIGGGVGLLVVVFVLLQVLSGDDGPVTVDEGSPALTTPTTSGAGGTDGSGDQPAETFEVFSTKNPFLPVRRTPVDTGDGGTGDGGTGDGGTGDGGTGDGGGGASGGTATAPGQLTRVALLDVFVDDSDTTVASVRVDGVVYTVAPGETFAQSFQLVALDGDCGDFLFGDSPFQLCAGEELLK